MKIWNGVYLPDINTSCTSQLLIKNIKLKLYHFLKWDVMATGVNELLKSN